jgi:protease-4
MKGFMKSVLATIVGILISSVIIGGLTAILFFGFIGLVMSGSSDSFALKENTVLTLNLKGVLKDRVTPNPFLEYLSMSEVDEMSLSDILSAIKKAKENNNIKGIYIHSGYFSASSASLNEIRNELLDFKNSGKFIIAYADTYLQSGYYLSSVADEVIINPQGSLDLHGISASPTFYKKTLDKLGIEMQIFKVGTYKSAVEPFINEKMSDANKEQVRSFTNSIWSTVLNGISASRDISIERLNTLTDTLPMFQESSFLVENGLVDKLMYETEVKEYLKKLLGTTDKKKINQASISDMTSVPFIANKAKDDKIAVLYAEGSIMSGSDPTEINDRYLIKEIEKLKNNDKIKAVVFRVNSPGGSAYASEQIWKAITELKMSKPVVVSMGDYAASGGYYISCNATKIFAQPNTLTGSIGIFGMFPNIEGLTDKIGLTFDNIKTNKFSDFGDVTRPMRSEEKALLQNYIERGYDLFLTRCSEGRNLPKEQMAQIAEGRVWTGTQALEIGLVDAIGGIDDAIKEAASLAAIKEYSVNEYPALPNPLEMFLKLQKDDIAAQLVKEYLGTDIQILKTVKEIKDLNQLDFIQARIPYDIELK